MERNAKKAIVKNRVRILSLDYFDLTAPLLASELLTTKKHKEIKTEATTSKARVDLLLEWLDESAPTEAFLSFLQGIRNCDEGLLAKKIKKEASNGGVDIKKPKIIKPTVPFPSVINPNILGLAVGTSSPDVKPKVAKKPKIKKEGSLGGVGTSLPTTTLPFNGLPSGLLKPLLPVVPSPANRKRKSGSSLSKDKPKTPGNLNGTNKPGDTGDVKIVTGPRPTVKATPKGNKNKTATPATASNKPLATPKPNTAGPSTSGSATPRTTRKSSNDKGEVKVKLPKPGKKKAQGAVGATTDPTKPKSPSKALAKAKPMTFKQVEEKQQDCRQKFKFKNVDAVAKFIHFKDKTDISYLGCPFEEDNKMCEKKVELKSKEFVCESRHKSPTCKQIPRLNVTCNDGTGDLLLTFMKNDVEIFSGKTSADLGTLSVNEIKDALDKTMGKKFSVEISCEKIKKASKKAGVPKWNNIATIWSNDEGSPAKKKRKN